MRAMHEAETARNVGAALRLFLRHQPDGADEQATIDALVEAGAGQNLVHEVIRGYVLAGWIVRRGERIYWDIG